MPTVSTSTENTAAVQSRSMESARGNYKTIGLLVYFLCILHTRGQDISDPLLYDGLRFKDSKPAKCRNSDLRTIQTNYGPVRGKKFEFDKDSSSLCPVVQFLGIPYAKPPTGERRWKKPEEPISWSGREKKAYMMGPVCPQKLDGPFPDALLPVWFRDAQGYIKKNSVNMSEDCLYLNIYVPMEFYANETRAPKTYKTRLPVMVYIHGHTFMEGSGNFYDGSVLASYGKVIVVTVNYRLGVLGFLSTLSDHSHGNYGLWDQIKALEWISDNIEKFGGDPKRVTLFGSGSGAASINLLMVIVQADYHFQRVILQSGTALSSWTIVRNPVSQTRLFSQHPRINCGNASKEAMMKCLRKRDWRDLVKADVQPEIYTLAFGPVVDRILLNDMPERLMDEGEYMNYPMILGVSQGDGYGFVQRRGRNPDGMAASEVMKRIYEKKDFELDVDTFVDGFYRYAGDGQGILRRIIEFMYTNWKNEPSVTTLRRSLLDLYTDKQWLQPAMKTAQMHLNLAYSVYFYTLFHRAGNGGAEPDWLDAGHGDELPFVFGYPFFARRDILFPYNFTKVDRMVSAGMMTYWTNFAKEGNPMEGSKQKTEFLTRFQNMFQNLQWQKYDKSEQRSLEISINPSIQDHYRSNHVAFWSSFLPDLLKESNQVCPGGNKITTLSPRIASGKFSTRSRAKTPPWVPKPSSLTTIFPSSSDGSGKADGGMSLQLTITLAIGFVLLFVNIIAFSVVSYHKEKDKFKIEKLEAQLEVKKRLFNEEPKKIDMDNEDGNGVALTVDETGQNDIPIDNSRVLEKTHGNMSAYGFPPYFASGKSPMRATSAATLPHLKPCVFHDDSIQKSAEDHGLQSRLKVFRKYGTYHSSEDGSPASMQVCNSKEELRNPECEIQGRKGDFIAVENGGRYSLQTTSSTTPEHKYRTLNGRPAVPGTVRLNVVDDETNRPTSLWSVVSSAAAPTYPKYGSDGVGARSDVSQGNAATLPHPTAYSQSAAGNIYAIHPSLQRGEAPVAAGVYIDRDLSCASKSALLASPADKSRFRSDTSESETDRTGSSSRSEAVGSYCVTNNKTMNVITKL